MLEVDGLATAYGQSQVLFGVSFGVDAGEVATLLGRNGMGKTTTVRSVMGMVQPRGGTIMFEGKALHGLPSYRVAQAGLGLVPEGPGLSQPHGAREPSGDRGQALQAPPAVDAGARIRAL